MAWQWCAPRILRTQQGSKDFYIGGLHHQIHVKTGSNLQDAPE